MSKRLKAHEWKGNKRFVRTAREAIQTVIGENKILELDDGSEWWYDEEEDEWWFYDSETEEEEELSAIEFLEMMLADFDK